MAAARRRVAAVALALVALEAAASIGACSTTSPEGEDGPDGSDGAAGDGPKDSPVVVPDAGKVGNCSPVNTACDIVLQNCPDKKECVVAQAGGTKCQTTQASQQLPMGRACCPGAQNPCLPGLTCVGLDCTDGGPVTARCTPACCKGNDEACGSSDPEGIAGACDITLVDDQGKPLHDQCTYRELCKPFKLQPCRTGQTCIVSDALGTATCIESNGGKTNRQACSFANECADGFVCLTGAPGQCRMTCLLPGEASPFDASVAEGGPGKGGCPAGEKCLLKFNDAPNWYGGCAFADGG